LILLIYKDSWRYNLIYVTHYDDEIYILMFYLHVFRRPLTYAMRRTYVCTEFFCVFNVIFGSLSFDLPAELKLYTWTYKRLTVWILSTPSGRRLFQIYCISPSFLTVGTILSSRLAFPEFNVYKFIKYNVFLFAQLHPSFSVTSLSLLKGKYLFEVLRSFNIVLFALFFCAFFSCIFLISSKYLACVFLFLFL